MPTLPNVTQLERRTPSVGRSVVSLRPAQIPLGPLAGGAGVEAEGQVRLAQAVAKIGETVHEVNEKLTTARRANVLGEAVGQATQALGELEISFDRDQDFRTAPKRFTDQAEALRAQIELGLDDDIVKQAFNQRFNELATVKRLNVLKASAKQEGDASVARLDSDLDMFAHSAANARSVAERAVILNQADVRITETKSAGWITDVDAGNRRRGFLGKLDAATVTRDMSANPGATATRLATDPEYAKNLDPARRETLIDAGWRKAEADRVQQERTIAAERKALGDAKLKDALSKLTDGTLTRDDIEGISDFIEPHEKRSLLEGLNGKDRKDDPTAYSALEGLIETNPAEASRQAFTFHRNGLITNATLTSINSRARTIERQEGPRTEYERSRAFITTAIKPSDLVPDPAASARYALAIREFDDFAAGGKRTDPELREKADDILKRHSMVNMVELAKQTAAGAQPTPQQQLEALSREAENLIKQRDEKKISPKEFNKKMADLNRARQAAERAQANGGK